MRKFTYFATIVLFAGLFSSCENGGNDLGDIQFKRMHLDGVKVLALASDGSDEQTAPRRAPAEEGEGEIVYDMSEPAYSVSEDGTLVEITYTIECRGRGEVIEKVKANMRLKMENIFSIGDDWLWLYSCYYDYPDLDKLEDPYRSMIKHKIDNFYGNFLVRKKDGALFYWDARDGRPIYTNEGVPFYQQSDLYSVVECINGEIYSNCWHLASYGQMLYRLKDEGSQLAVTKMHNNTLFSTSIAPDDRGVIGLDIFYEGVNGSSPGILFINDNLDITNIEEPENDPTLQGVSGLQWAFISIQNTLHLSRITTNWR